MIYLLSSLLLRCYLMSSAQSVSNSILSEIEFRTNSFLEYMPKSKRKSKGQFFTSPEIAEYMANMFSLNDLPADVCILDPGAGSGILSAAIIERLNKLGKAASITLDCFETDPSVINLLVDNLELIKTKSLIPMNYRVLEDDYLLSQQHDFNEDLLSSTPPKKYDLVISNPPYLRIIRDNPISLAMSKVVHGAPNMYFLFAAMSLFNLKHNGEMVYIIPRSWTSGLYFKRFREYLLSNGVLEHVHLFVSRDKVFSNENVLQETIIMKVKKTHEKPKTVKITSSNSSNDFSHVTTINADYSVVVAGEDSFVFLPTNDNDIITIRKIHSFAQSMPVIGIKMKTGIVVDFRQWDYLRDKPGEHVVPLFYSQHIRNGRVHHQPSGKEKDWIVDNNLGLVQKNRNSVFCKRFTAKEEKRRLQCGIYLSSDFPNYHLIGTHNKINFVDSVDGSDLSVQTVYGIYALLNSSLFDSYYRILNGSTQVNSTEINSIPVPPISVINQIGELLLKTEDLSTLNCDKIVGVFYEQNT